MPLTVYLDDDADYELYIRVLRQAGHIVVSPRDSKTTGLSDREHLAFSAQHGYVLMTYNHPDYLREHERVLARGASHSGIFAIYREHDVSKDMTAHDIIRAIAHIEASGLSLTNGFFKLNEWQ